MATTVLLDTCAFIWLTQEPGNLSLAATEAINDPTGIPPDDGADEA